MQHRLAQTGRGCDTEPIRQLATDRSEAKLGQEDAKFGGVNSQMDCKSPEHGVNEKKIKDKAINALSSRRIKKSKVSRRRLFKDEESMSPVLGLRIVPAKEATTTNDMTTETAGNRTFSGTPSSVTDNSPVQNSNFACKLCKNSFKDPLQLASHRCVRIENVQYNCPECGKSFSCPANLASHRRWHKPRAMESISNSGNGGESKKENSSGAKLQLMDAAKKEERAAFSCSSCGKSFLKRSHLKHHEDTNHCDVHIVEKTTNSSNISSKFNQADDAQSNSDSFAGKTRIDLTRDSFCHRDLGGLVALAFAAEVHGRMSPQENIETPGLGRNLIGQTDSSATEVSHVERKRLPPSNSSSQEPCKRTKFDTLTCGKSDTISRSYSWLPPSPPPSDLSCSPKSTISDESEEKVVQTRSDCSNNTKDFGKESPADNAVKPRSSIVRPFETSTAGESSRNRGVDKYQYIEASKSMNLQYGTYFNIRDKTPLLTSNAINTGVMPKAALSNAPYESMRFHEPFHPYPYNGVHAPVFLPGRPVAAAPSWNSWSLHSSTAWRTPTYIPLYYTPTVPHSK